MPRGRRLPGRLLRPVDGEGQLLGHGDDRLLIQDFAAADHREAARLARFGDVDVEFVHDRRQVAFQVIDRGRRIEGRDRFGGRRRGGRGEAGSGEDQERKHGEAHGGVWGGGDASRQGYVTTSAGSIGGQRRPLV